MMKRLLLLLLAVVICIPSVEARRRSPKAGSLKDGVYTDAVYNFTIKLPKDWDISIKKQDDPVRFVLVKKNYQIPPDYLDAEDYTEVPRVTVYMAESPMSAIAFRDSLVSKTYESDQKNDIRKYFEILNDQSLGEGTTREPTVTMDRTALYVDSLRAASWEGQSTYIKNITTSVSAQSGKRVYGGYSGGIVTVKNGKYILLFHLMTEKLYFDQNWKEIMPMIESLKWAEGAADSKDSDK